MNKKDIISQTNNFYLRFFGEINGIERFYFFKSKLKIRFYANN